MSSVRKRFSKVRKCFWNARKHFSKVRKCTSNVGKDFSKVWKGFSNVGRDFSRVRKGKFFIYLFGMIILYIRRVVKVVP